jgi:hypothetical protein
MTETKRLTTANVMAVKRPDAIVPRTKRAISRLPIRSKDVSRRPLINEKATSDPNTMYINWV